MKRNSELGEERGGGGTIAMKTGSPRAACAPPPDELPRARPGPMGRLASAPRPPNERRADERTVGRCGRARGGDPSALAPGSRRAAGRRERREKRRPEEGEDCGLTVELGEQQSGDKFAIHCLGGTCCCSCGPM